MKFIFFSLFFLVSLGCNDNKSTNIDVQLPEPDWKISSDTVLTYNYQLDFSDKNIINTTNKKVDLLYSGIKNYFGGDENDYVSFRTECLQCQPIQIRNNSLFFAKQLQITTDHIYYHLKPAFTDSSNQLQYNEISDRDNKKFTFSNGVGLIKYQGISCSDAEFNRVELIYQSGKLIFDSLINARFFEFDLDKNGNPEEYLIGSRNCSQEMAILRIR